MTTPTTHETLEVLARQLALEWGIVGLTESEKLLRMRYLDEFDDRHQLERKDGIAVYQQASRMRGWSL